MNIDVGEKTCIRLSVFADKHNLSLSAAIDRLLDTQQGVGEPPLDEAVSQPRSSHLEIVYFPEGEESFKRALLKIPSVAREVLVRIHYSDGRLVNKLWGARGIQRTSAIRENLLAHYLRGWRKEGIVKAEIVLLSAILARYEESLRKGGELKHHSLPRRYVDALDRLKELCNVDARVMTSKELQDVYLRLRAGNELHRLIDGKPRTSLIRPSIKKFARFVKSLESNVAAFALR